MAWKLRFCFRALSSICLLAAVDGNATTITTTSFTTWKNSFVTGTPTQLNFYPIQSVNYNTAGGITLSPSGSSLPFVFTGPDNGGYNLVGDTYAKALWGASDTGAYINIALPTDGENAFFLGVGATASKPTTVTLSDGEVFSVASPNFGVALSKPVSWLRLSVAPGSQAYINDFLFGVSALPADAMGSAVTPEPATILLCLSGGGLVLFGSRRKHLFS